MAIDPVLVRIIRRCQKDPSWFINNFCKVKHPKLGIIPFKLFKYQKRCLKEFLANRFNVFRKCRQVGISTLTGAFALWYAMFSSNKTILIVSKRDDDAKDYLAKNVKFVYTNLPAWMRQMWTTNVINEHTIGFTNGSTIRSLTSSPDTLRSQAASLNIIDEAAFIDKMDIMWRGGHSTLQHGGCLASNSLVLSGNGLIKIGELHKSNDDWEDINLQVKSDFGYGLAYKSYHNGVVKTKKITTSDGYNIESSLNHKFRVLEDGKYLWKTSKDISIGDRLVLSASPTNSDIDQHFDLDLYHNYDNGCYDCGKKCGKEYCISCITSIRMIRQKYNLLPTKIETEFAEFVGILIGDGTMERSGNAGRFSISCNREHQYYIQHLHAQILKLFHSKPRNEVSDKDFSVRFNNKALMLMLSKNGYNKIDAFTAHVPEFILQSSSSIQSAFLRGYFEADGCISRNMVTASSASYKLLCQVQIMLLSLGIRSRLKFSKRKNGFSKKDRWVLTLKSIQEIYKFRDLIGLISDHKQERLNNVPITKRCHNDNFDDFASINEFYDASIGMPGKIRQGILNRKNKGTLSRYYVISMAKEWPDYLSNTILGKLASAGLFIDKVVDLKESISDTYDISVKDHCTYIANGFVSHNSAIIVSTPRGVGNWYYKTWIGAINKENEFNPILINWWDMDWELKYKDELSGKETIISPARDIRKSANQKELEKYGPYWSPWLENEYRQLATKGDDSSFRQEVLAEFIGSGDTVLKRNALFAVEQMVENEELEDLNNDDPGYLPIGRIDYIDPKSGAPEILDFHDTLHIWEKPYTKIDADMAMRKARELGSFEEVDPLKLKQHSYILGADTSTGEANDFCSIQVLDLDAREQVAELKIRTLPKTFAKMIDYVGRMYNNAFVVCERTGIGAAVCQELDYDIMYPNLYRHKRISASLKIKYNQIGYPTSHSSKAVLVKHLVDNIGEDGWLIRSSRLYHELCIFIHLGGGRYGNEPGVGNTDDLVLALTFALVGVDEAIRKGNQMLSPFHSTEVSSDIFDNKIVVEKHQEFVAKGGKHVIAPIGITSEVYTGKANAANDLAKFTAQLGGVPLGKNKKPLNKQDIVSFKKHILKYFK